MEHPEDDPTAVEPEEADLPDKPAIEDMPPEEGEAPPEEEEDVPEEEFLDPAVARDDDTVDDQEDDTASA